MKTNYTDITVLLDESGSMGTTKNATIEGFNSFLKSQQEAPGECTISLVPFQSSLFGSSNLESPALFQYEAKDIQKAPKLTQTTYKPNGGTPLYDYLAATIDATGRRLAGLKEESRPDKVIFVIITDGEENASRKYSIADVRNRIQTQTKDYNWQFIYLGANVDAFSNASSIGISTNTTLNFAQNSQGINSSYLDTACLVKSMRSADSGDLHKMSYSTQAREAQNQAAGTVINVINGTNSTNSNQP